MPRIQYTDGSMKTNQYHIDVTPEEDMLFRDTEVTETPVTRHKMFNLPIVVGIVLVHFAGAAALFGTSPKKEPEVQQPIPAAPTPSPTPITTTSPETSPKAAPPQPSPVPKNTGEGSLTASYTVKPGDTFYSIVKKFKLNSQTLIKLNNIQDPAKIRVGQVLKFVK